MDNRWISVEDRLPELIDDDYSEEVLCVGHKGTHRNDPNFVRYEVMSYEKLCESKQTRINYKGEKILYGWSNDWWNTNPDLYDVSHWMPLPKPPIV